MEGRRRARRWQDRPVSHYRGGVRLRRSSPYLAKPTEAVRSLPGCTARGVCVTSSPSSSALSRAFAPPRRSASQTQRCTSVSWQERTDLRGTVSRLCRLSRAALRPSRHCSSSKGTEATQPSPTSASCSRSSTCTAVQSDRTSPRTSGRRSRRCGSSSKWRRLSPR